VIFSYIEKSTGNGFGRRKGLWFFCLTGEKQSKMEILLYFDRKIWIDRIKFGVIY